MYYSDLTETQTFNFSHLLEYALKNQMDKLQQRYPDIIKKQKLNLYRDNIIQTIMHNNITIDEIYNWLCDLNLETSNTIIHFEYSKFGNSSIGSLSPKLIDTIESSKKHILSVSADEIENPELVNFSNNKDELELCILFPAKILKEERNVFSQRKIYYQKSALYFTYVWINKKDKSITISLPPISIYHSIYDNSNKKNLVDFITRKTISFLESFLGDISFLENDWVNHALRKITGEYYYHNNPKIEKELEKIKQNKKSIDFNGEKISLIDVLSKLSDDLRNELTLKRLEKALDSAIERELILQYQMKPCQHPFEVFLHEVNKGPTTFKSRSGQLVDSTKALPQLDTRDIIMNMLESSSLKAIGLKFYSKEASVSYKITCKDKWFVLEQTNNTSTEKELVKRVLSEFKKYKGREYTTQRTADI